jgi:hypothetical protein
MFMGLPKDNPRPRFLLPEFLKKLHRLNLDLRFGC